MSDPHIATAIRTTIKSVADACAEMKKQAAPLTDGPHRAGMLQGIDLCIDAVRRLETEVDDASRRIGSFWQLIGSTGKTLFVSAVSEEDARDYAEQYTGVGWSAADGATCRQLSANPPGFVIVTREGDEVPTEPGEP